MSINKTIIGISAGLILLISVIIYVNYEKEGSFYKDIEGGTITIEKIWELPAILEEISGIDYLGENKIAGVQDEKGIIFIYNLKTSKIEDKIDFAGSGDYEGITVNNTVAYVLRADGTLFEVRNFKTNPRVNQFKTHLTAEQDVEGITFDENNNRLLLAIKEKDPTSKLYKGIYSFNLNTMKSEKSPVFKIDLKDSIFDGIEEKKTQNIFKPSEIAIAPKSGDIFLLEAENPKILILNPNGEIKKMYLLNKDRFPQPEGLTFSSGGTMYISNEGSPATIYRVSIN